MTKKIVNINETIVVALMVVQGGHDYFSLQYSQQLTKSLTTTTTTITTTTKVV